MKVTREFHIESAGNPHNSVVNGTLLNFGKRYKDDLTLFLPDLVT